MARESSRFDCCVLDVQHLGHIDEVAEVDDPPGRSAGTKKGCNLEILPSVVVVVFAGTATVFCF